MVACSLTTASPKLTSPCSAGTLPSHTTGGSMERFQSMQISPKETLGRFFPASPLSTLLPKRRMEESPMILIISQLNERRPQRLRKSTCRSMAARKELATRFDFKGITAEILPEKDKITLTAEDAGHLRGLREILIGKLSKRGVDLRNIEQDEPAISSVGHARQELKIQQGLEGDKAKEIIQAIKSEGFKVQSQLQDRQIRVTGKKKDDLQAVIQFVRGRDFGVATNFKNFRD